MRPWPAPSFPRLAVVLLLAALAGAAQAATRYVGACGTPNTATIAAAISAASAGDTINICPGTYNESVTVDKTGLTIKGSTGVAADVKVTGTYPFTLTAASLTLKDMTLNTTGTGVYTNNSSTGPHVFENLVVSTGSFGFYLAVPTAAASFKNVAVTASTNMGIFIGWNGTGAHVFDGVTAVGGDWGIYLDRGATSLKNVVAEGKTKSAIRMGNLHAATFSNVTATSSGGYDHGIGIAASDTTNHPYTFTKVTASGKNRGINIDRSGKVTMTDVTATGTGESGIYLNWNADGAHEFENVTATGNGGLSLQRGAASFRSVTATGTAGSAIWMGNKYAASFDTVTASAPNHRGIEIANSDNTNHLYSFTNVKVTSKDRGINIDRSGKVTMNGITMTTDNVGIWFNWNADGAHELSNLDITSSQTAIYAARGLAKIEDFKIGNGIFVGDLHDTTIRRGTISGPGLGIDFNSPTKKVTIQDVTVSTNWDYAIMLRRSSEALIQRVCVSGMTNAGIYTDWGATNVTLRDSQFGNSGTYGGVMISSDPDKKATVTNNAFLKPTPWRAWSNSTKHNFTGNYWQGVAGGTNHTEGNINDKKTLGSNPVASCYSASAALSAHYKFDDTWGAADTLEDSASSSKHATLNGTVAQESAPASGGKPNTCKAGSFNKTGWFATASGLDIDTAKDGKNSVSFWMYWDGGFSSSNFTMPFSWGGVYYDLAVSKYRSEMGNGAIGFNTGNGDIYGVTADGLANGWHHVAAVFNNGDTDKNKLYIDGVQKTLKSYGGQSTRSATTSAGIGAGAGWGGDYKWSGKLDNLKIYRGAISSAQIAADMAEATPCAGPDHIRIEHGGSGVTCAPSTLTLKACADAPCTSLYSGGVTGTLTATGTPTVNWVGGANFAIGATGLVTKDVQVTTAGNVVWGASGVAPAATSGTRCFIGATENCSFASALAGFLFDVPNHLSDTTQTIAVSAVKQSDSSLACAPAFASTSKTVGFSCGYSDPASGTLPVVVGGSNITCGTTTGVALNFNASGVATTTVRYADVGQMSLTASYTGMTGSDNFIAAPASFTVVPGGPYEAGTPFSVTVTAKNASGATTPNFGAESTTENVSLTHALTGPAGGNDPVLEGTTTLADATFDAGNGVATASDIEWDEVGDINLTATLASASYLGSGLSATGSAAAGPFKPAYFTTAVTPGTGSFTYAGQPFTVNVTAMNADGATTRNYEGAYAKAVTLTDANSATNNSGTLGAFSNATVAAASFTAGVATATTIKYDFTTKTTAPLEAPGSLPLKLRATDTDGVTSNFGATPVEGTTPIRAGRLRLVNFYGSELLAPRVEYRAEYWDGNRWTINALDSTTAIVAGNIATGGLTVGAVGALTNGVGFINFATAAAGSYDIAFNLNASGSDTSCNTAHGGTAANMPWLQGYWSGSCGGTPAWRQDPGARIRLGSPKAPYIYLRERY